MIIVFMSLILFMLLDKVKEKKIISKIKSQNALFAELKKIGIVDYFKLLK